MITLDCALTGMAIVEAIDDLIFHSNKPYKSDDRYTAGKWWDDTFGEQGSNEMRLYLIDLALVLDRIWQQQQTDSSPFISWDGDYIAHMVEFYALQQFDPTKPFDYEQQLKAEFIRYQRSKV
jgi:hypothetical protein